MIQVGFNACPSTFQDGYTGTVTLNADDTFDLTNTDTEYTNVPPAGKTSVNKKASNNVRSGAWMLAGQTFTLVITGGSSIKGTCNLGGRLRVATILTDEQGAVNLLVLRRTN